MVNVKRFLQSAFKAVQEHHGVYLIQPDENLPAYFQRVAKHDYKEHLKPKVAVWLATGTLHLPLPHIPPSAIVTAKHLGADMSHVVSEANAARKSLFTADQTPQLNNAKEHLQQAGYYVSEGVGDARQTLSALLNENDGLVSQAKTYATSLITHYKNH